VATIQIGMPLQIFNRNQGNIARTQAELASAHSEVQRVELALQDRLADAFEQYANSRQQTQRYISDILPDATTTLELVRAGYEQGEFGYLELLTAQRTYFRASLAYVESLRELRLSGIRIEGMLMTGAIDSTSE
jgi:cobalt-zinc-cadmium efflux system outer membrane protein